jgi:hypothetical protein
MFDEVTQAEYLICRRWPEAERAAGRADYFRTERDGPILLIPVHNICPACERAHQAWTIAVRRHLRRRRRPVVVHGVVPTQPPSSKPLHFAWNLISSA